MTFYELEKKCKAKKRRFYLILIVLIFFVLLLIGFGFYFLTKKSDTSSKASVKKEKKEVKKSIKKESKLIEESKKTSKNKNTLEFILPDIEINQSVKEVKKESKKFLPVVEVNKIKSAEKKNEVKKETTQKEQKKVTLITSTIPSFETCINLAKKYYKEKDYNEALKWAKYANIQDKKNPLSWIISAKILYASGKKEEALKLLKIYDSYYNNKEVKRLIKEFNEK